MSNMQIQNVLAQARALAARASAAGDLGAPASGPEPSDFSMILKRSLEQVNASQLHASDLAARFSAGMDDTTLPEVMVAVQKASLGFEAVTQVRNRLLAAYQEIMNMPV